MLNQYTVIKVIQESRSGTVYLVKHNQMQVKRILKCIKKSNLVSQSYLKESIILSKLHHSKIPIVYEVQEDKDSVYIIMQYIKGQSLKKYRSSYHHISERTILSISIQICEIIEYLHSLENPILHLDLKPDNFIIHDNEVYLVDFGAAIFKNEQDVVACISGTVGYAAPEQYRGEVLDERTDIYGIGMIMYYLVTGQACINKETIIHNVDRKLGYSKHLKKIINTCIQDKKAFRYSRVSHITRELKNKRYVGRLKERLNTVRSIAVAGSKHGVGTTTVALTIQQYLTYYKRDAVVIEKNLSGDMVKMINKSGDFAWKEFYYNTGYSQIIPHERVEAVEACSDYILVKDYGCLDAENQKEFLDADLCLYVTMLAPWEEEVGEYLQIEGNHRDSKVLFIANLATKEQVTKVSEQYGLTNAFRFPYSSLSEKRKAYDAIIWNQIKRIIEV